MPEALSRMGQQISEFWNNLDKSQKTRIYVLAGISVAAVLLSVFLVTRTSYVNLISNQEPKEVASMKKILDDKKIINKSIDNGRSIQVDKKDYEKASLELALQDYPKGGMTFDDIFNKYIKINTTESDKEKIWLKYKQDSLKNMLKMMDNIRDASVELAIPKKTLFVGKDLDNQKPTAIVQITPKGELNSKQITGIKQVVSKAVENLNPKDVSVVDNNLNPLDTDTGEESIDKMGSQYEISRKKAVEIEKKVKDMFNGHFDNFDSIRVVANPILDFNKVISKTQAVSKPEGVDSGGALISQKQVKENLTNAGAGGTPGTDSNPGAGTTPSYQIGTGNNGTYKKESLEQNFEWTKTLTDAEKALGILDLDKSSMTVTLLYGNRVKDDSKITQEFLDQFKNDISSASGIPAAKISVNKYKVVPPEVPLKKTTDIIQELVNAYGFFALMLLLILVLIIFVLPKKRSILEEEPAFAEMQAASGPRFIVPETSSEEIPEIALEERSEVKKQIEKFVKQKPEAVAQLLRNWLTDEWE